RRRVLLPEPRRQEISNAIAIIAQASKNSLSRIKRHAITFRGLRMTTLRRRIIRAGGWGVAKRLIKPIPIVGSVFAFGLAGYEIRRKGLIAGAVHVGLDVTPVVGTAKGVVELFTGDLIPDKSDRSRKKAQKAQQRNHQISEGQ